MGLDMTLSKKTYVKNWDTAGIYKVSVLKGGKPVAKKLINPDKITWITEDVMYWRKANAIHNWFVENVQGGVDDCKDYYVYPSQLKELLDIVDTVIAASELVEAKIENGYTFKQKGKNMVKSPIMVDGKKIKDPTKAAELLPTQDGFFFGGTSYDEYYYHDLVETSKVLTKALENDPNGDYEYSSSW